MSGLSISEMVERTGVSEGTLRMWERRHGFPVPDRLPSRHRRYSEEQLELVRQVLAGRSAGLSLGAAIDRACRSTRAAPESLYATLRRRYPRLQPLRVSRPLLRALSHAVEDECLARAERAVLFGSFQRERFYRRSAPRWRELCRGAESAFVFADFSELRRPADGPVEVPVPLGHPLAREWTIACDAPRHGVVLCGREPADSGTSSASGRRAFEVMWSVEPEVVRAATRVCAEILASVAPERAETVQRRLAGGVTATTAEQLRLATAISGRLLAALSRQ